MDITKAYAAWNYSLSASAFAGQHHKIIYVCSRKYTTFYCIHTLPLLLRSSKELEWVFG